MIDLLGLPSEALTDATKQVSGEHAAGGQQAAYNASNQFMNVISDPFAFGRGFTGSCRGDGCAKARACRTELSGCGVR